MADRINQAQVQEALAELDPATREMLLILAFNRFGIPSYKLSAISLQLGERRNQAPQINRSQATELGKALKKRKLVTQKKGQWQVASDWAWPLARWAFFDAKSGYDLEEIRHYEASLNKEIPYSYWNIHTIGENLLLRILQFALLLADEEQLHTAIHQLNQIRPNDWDSIEALHHMLGNPVDRDLIKHQSPLSQRFIWDILLYKRLRDLENPSEIVAGLRGLITPDQEAETRLRALKQLIHVALLQQDEAQLSELIRAIEPLDAGEANLATASLAFWRGDHACAQKEYAAASRKLKARGYFTDMHGLWHCLNFLFRQDYKKVHSYSTKGNSWDRLITYTNGVALFQQNQTGKAKFDLVPPDGYDDLAIVWFGYALTAYWVDQELSKQDLAHLQTLYQRAHDHGYVVIARELALVLARLGPTAKQEHWQTLADAYQADTTFLPLLPRQQRSEMWERALEQLIAIGETGTSKGKSQSHTRLVWRVDFEYDRIQPIEQKLTKTGKWSKGRNVALKRLQEEGVEGMTPQDQRIVRHLQVRTSGWYGHTEYVWDIEGAIAEMVNHPLLFLESNPQLSVELTDLQPELVISQGRDKTYSISIYPEVYGSGIILRKETTTRYQLTHISDQQWQIIQALNKGTVKVPASGRDQLAKAIGKVASVMRVQSDLQGTDDSSITNIDSNHTPHVLLVPMGDDFKVEVFTKPFGEEPPYLKPGKGRSSLIAELNGERVRTERNLSKEKSRAKQLVKQAETLSQNPSTNWEWYLEGTEDCLNLLLELDTLRQAGEVMIEWPKGESLKLAGKAAFSQLSLRVKGSQDWFSVDGELSVDEGQVITLQALLSSMRQQPDSQFIELNDGRFLALTEGLRKQLREFEAYAQERRGKLGLHPLMADSLEAFSELGADLKANAAWRKQVKRIEEARQFRPNIPPNLQADLRTYQEEGYFWLARLAHWGVGACLADDMGLGKTLQALTLLLQRASLGPALVAAPASVVRNWLREAERFAPDLHPILLSEGNRDETIASLGAYDVLLVSYGLLPHESERLNTVSFATVVLDEAQAIKNRQTKRSKAAKALQADCRILTTGTPIENHLGELWNLFDFLNPGLLGSLEHFNERFAIPIERHQDPERRQQLRKLLRPFILRRRKSEVLTELPPKTEITLTVERSEAEQTFYEALRREAVERLNDLQGENAGEDRIRILAEITRLRQACCHPELVNPGINIDSSKLALFGEVIQELRENGHKALVFSQFVKYLRIIEKWVQQAGISYQYLDGQTPGKLREKRVQAFQRGEGDLFLISLKAGGTGLNLTAADYVIHLDPWWNPAVEDQASDRAHRIGQQRPVTVYRLVAENSIEEKIVRLHQDKRELADSLLEGSESSAKLSSEDLIALIREG